MKAYVLPTLLPVAPFSELASACLVGNRPLRQVQETALRAAGVEPIYCDKVDSTEEHLVLFDNLYFSSELIRDFVARSQRLTRENKVRTNCLLKKGGFTLRSAANLQNVADNPKYISYRLYYYPAGMEQASVEESTRNVVIDPDELNASIPTPVHISGVNRYAIPLTTKPLIQIDHWVNLWVANITEALLTAARLQSSSKLKQLWLALKSRSINKWTVLRQANVIGRGCDIHPTAYVEGSVLGDGVSLGAGTIVRNSAIGNNVSIGNGVVIEESVVGEGSVILHGRMIFSVMYPHTFSVGDMITASFIGRDCFIGLNSTLTDFRLDSQNVTVLQNGKRTESGNRFLGSCLGNGVYIGAGCVVSPGRTIPEGTRLALAEDRIVCSCPEEAGAHDITGYRLVNKL